MALNGERILDRADRPAVGITVISARPAERIERPAIDLEHLDRTTFGDRTLRTEVLRLFLSQTTTQIGILRSTDDLALRREAAHTLAGAARGIGAFKVATLASEIERAKGPILARLKGLEGAVDAARNFISPLVRD